MEQHRRRVLEKYGRKLTQIGHGDWQGLFSSGLLPEDYEEKERKIDIAKRNLHRILLPALCRRIAISGSVAVGCPRREDDIDIFVIVRDDTLWLYRLWIKLLGGRIVARRFDKDLQDKFCVNFIVEKGALESVKEDTVAFEHEWRSLIDLWVSDGTVPSRRFFFLIKWANELAYLGQMGFTVLAGGKMIGDKRVVKVWERGLQ